MGNSHAIMGYDTIRYDIFTCAHKLKCGQLGLAHGTETKFKEKIQTKR